MSEPFIGEIRMFGFNYPPRGWTTCAGQLLQIAQHNALFALLGSTYGGDGRTTFGVPDLRGRAPISYGQAPGLSYYPLGQRGGAEGVLLAEAQIPSHNHTATPDLEINIPAKNGAGNQGSPGGHSPAEYTVTGGRVPENLYSDAPDASLAGTVDGTIAVSDTGGSQQHENRPPYIAMNYCMALEGLFPPRN